MRTFKFKNGALVTTFALISLFTPDPSLFGEFYLGVFGGGGDTKKTHVSQRGFAFNDPDVTAALHVDANGESGHFGSSNTCNQLGSR
jgi:hypothetical protein